MTPLIRNTLIFAGIFLVIYLSYVFFFKDKGVSDEVLYSENGSMVENVEGGSQVSLIEQEFLPILLNIQNLKLDDSLFRDPAFLGLQDSSITLTDTETLYADGSAGRPNPFAPIGVDIVTVPINTTTVTPPATTAPVTN